MEEPYASDVVTEIYFTVEKKHVVLRMASYATT